MSIPDLEEAAFYIGEADVGKFAVNIGVYTVAYERVKELEAENAELRAEVEKLQAIVDTLPKDAEGNTVIPSTCSMCHPRRPEDDLCEWWQDADGEWFAEDHVSYSVGGLKHYAKKVSECYKTREAAEAAKEGER